jgi:tetratricopeptide (TPR) repeat protein
MERFEDALVNYNKCVKLDPAHADAWLGIGVVLDALNRLTEGIHYIKKAIEINPNDAEYWYVFAEVQHKLGFLEESAMAFQRVIELDYEDFDVWLDYSKLLHEAGYLNDSIATLAEGIKHFPTAADLQYRMGVMLLEKNSRKESMEFIAKALELDYNKHEQLFEYAPVLEKDAEIISLISHYKK